MFFVYGSYCFWRCISFFVVVLVDFLPHLCLCCSFCGGSLPHLCYVHYIPLLNSPSSDDVLVCRKGLSGCSMLVGSQPILGVNQSLGGAVFIKCFLFRNSACMGSFCGLIGIPPKLKWFLCLLSIVGNVRSLTWAHRPVHTHSHFAILNENETGAFDDRWLSREFVTGLLVSSG